MTDLYVDTETYRRLVAALAVLEADFWKGDLETQVIITLGEIGGIWPESIREEGEQPSPLAA